MLNRAHCASDSYNRKKAEDCQHFKPMELRFTHFIPAINFRNNLTKSDFFFTLLPIIYTYIRN